MDKLLALGQRGEWGWMWAGQAIPPFPTHQVTPNHPFSSSFWTHPIFRSLCGAVF